MEQRTFQPWRLVQGLPRNFRQLGGLMAFSADQLARLTAGHTDAQYRVLVSGERNTVALQDIDEGQVFTNFPTTTLNGAITNVSTTITVVSTSGFPATGAIRIAAEGANVDEWLTYTGTTGTTFTGLTRQSPTAHASGATVSKWVDITSMVTSLTFREVLQDEVGKWTADLSGINYDNRLLAQNSTILVMARWYPTSAGAYWSDWDVFFLGYIGAGQVKDDYKRGAEWQKPVRGIDFYLENADAPARRYGRANLALNGNTSASTALTDASTIGHPGEVYGSPTLASSHLVDDSISTVYCSVAIPQQVAGDTGSAFVGAYIAEVGFGPVGTGDEGAYFVLWVGTHVNSQEYVLRDSSIHNRQSWSGVDYTGVGINTKDNLQLPTISVGERIIFCRNREVFEQWAGPQDAEVIEWRTMQDAANFELRKAGDFLQLTSNHYGSTMQVRWGDEATGTAWEGVPAIDFGESIYRPDFSVNNQDDTDWILTDTPVPARNAQVDTQAYASTEIPEFAITLAANITSGSTTITVAPSTAGLNQSGGTIQLDSEMIEYSAATSLTLTGCTRGAQSTTASSHTAGAVLWAVDSELIAHKTEMIGRIGWKRKRVLAAVSLSSTINNSATTITLSTLTGLTLPSGRIRIDDEQIDYTDTTYAAGTVPFQITSCTRGVNGTTATSHTAGADIYGVNGLEIHRLENIIVPQDFRIWTSRLASPEYPTTDPTVTTWHADWTEQQVVPGNTGVEWSTPDVWPSALARHVMMVCARMQGDTRFLLNELYALRAAGYDPSATVAETGGDIAEQMLTDFGLDASLIDVDAFGPIGTHLVTAKGRYMARLMELAKLLGGQVIVTRDNRVRFERSPWHPLATLPDVQVTLTRSYGRVVGLAEGRRNVIAQVILKANNTETGETFTVQHPPTARALGDTVEIERVFYGSENEARFLAQMIYRQMNSQNSVTFTPAGHADGFRIGQRVLLTWDMDRADNLYNGRNFIVTGVGVHLEHAANSPKVCDWTVTLQEYITP